MATIKSSATSDSLVIDPTSKAARVTLYDSAGRELSLQKRATYVATKVPTSTTAAAAAVVIANLIGSASKTVRVHKIIVTGSKATAAENTTVLLAKRTAAASGGTSSATTPIPVDSANSAATATSNFWTVVGSAGTGLGFIDQKSMTLPVTAGTSEPGEVIFEAPVGTSPDAQAYTLRGTGESLEVSFNTTLGHVPVVGVTFIFTEES